jgi:hypothetical protein
VVKQRYFYFYRTYPDDRASGKYPKYFLTILDILFKLDFPKYRADRSVLLRERVCVTSCYVEFKGNRADATSFASREYESRGDIKFLNYNMGINGDSAVIIKFVYGPNKIWTGELAKEYAMVRVLEGNEGYFYFTPELVQSVKIGTKQIISASRGDVDVTDRMRMLCGSHTDDEIKLYLDGLGVPPGILDVEFL